MNKLFNIIDKPSRRGMPRNGFSMDHSRQFALNAGELHCPTNFELVPGDSINIMASAFFRAMTLNSAAFANCKVLCDWYFVPYVQLWSLFDNFLTQRDDDRFSSALKSSLYQPYLPLRQLIGSIYATKWNTLINNSFSDFFLFNSTDRALQLLDELGYGNWFPMYDWWKYNYDLKESGEDYDESIDDWEFIPDKMVNLWPILAYQKIWNAYYRDSEVDTPLPTEIFNVDNLDCSTHEKASYLYGVNDGDTLRHMLFDNVAGNRGLLNLRYRKWTRDIFTSTQPSTQFGVVSTVPVSVVVENGENDVTGSDNGRWIGSSSVANLAMGLAGGTSSSRSVYQGLIDGDGKVSPASGASPATHNHKLPQITSEGVGSFSVLLQKYSEAMQEWRQNALRAGNRMKDNMRAHYGVEPYYHNDTEPLHLQSWEFTMQPTDVTATANTGEGGNNELGSTTGKLVGGSEFNRPVQFNARDFGVVMCIVSVIPQSGYDSYMLDKKLTKGSSPYDYYWEEFDSIGLQPVNLSELNMCASKGSLAACDYSLGYHARYSDYKYMLSKSFHLFEHNHTGLDDGFNGAFSSYVTNRFDLQSIHEGFDQGSPVFSRFFRYVNPSVLSSIFVQETPAIDSPQFICTFGFYGSKVSNMSLLGMPRF